MNYVKYARGEEVTYLREVVNRIHVWAITRFWIKSCKVDKDEFKIEGGETEVLVKRRVVDKKEFKDDGCELKIIMKSCVVDKKCNLKSEGCEVKVIV